jgi:hypothetical protein
MLIPMPYLLEDREWVGITLWERMENGDYFMCQQRTDEAHPDFPRADGIIQMDMERAFTIVQTGPRCSSVELVTRVNMGGALPSWVNSRITIPNLKSVPIAIQQYVREGAAAAAAAAAAALGAANVRYEYNRRLPN